MDPITTAIIAAAPFVGKKIGEHLVSDAYGKLKGWIKNRFGEKHAVVEAMDKIEQKQSEGHKLVLRRRLWSGS